MKQTLVREVMTTPVVTAEETMPLRHLMALLYAALRLVEAARRAEGVIHIDNQLSYDIDDRYPALPAGF